MARIPRIMITGEPTAYHIMSRTALEGYPMDDIALGFWGTFNISTFAIGMLFEILKSYHLNQIYFTSEAHPLFFKKSPGSTSARLKIARKTPSSLSPERLGMWYIDRSPRHTKFHDFQKLGGQTQSRMS